MQKSQAFIYDKFFSQAKLLRGAFDKRFADPLRGGKERFIWDYWHVPELYTHLRTPAPNFFPEALYISFHRQLVEWGRATLGCHDISPPWLSCYVEGCRQELHCDVPHGPLAFVYSLTPWPARQFTGGQTFLLKDRTLNFWSTLTPALQKLDMIETVEPKFNRLIVFDPAIPHGVREVRGTHDPRQGRLVIHGWFVNPRPFWYGPLNADDIGATLDTGLSEALNGELNLGRGLLSARINILPSGEVQNVRYLFSTLVFAQAKDLKRLKALLKKLKFPKRKRKTELTLPLMIE